MVCCSVCCLVVWLFSRFPCFISNGLLSSDPGTMLLFDGKRYLWLGKLLEIDRFVFRNQLLCELCGCERGNMSIENRAQLSDALHICIYFCECISYLMFSCSHRNEIIRVEY